MLQMLNLFQTLLDVDLWPTLSTVSNDINDFGSICRFWDLHTKNQKL